MTRIGLIAALFGLLAACTDDLSDAGPFQSDAGSDASADSGDATHAPPVEDGGAADGDDGPGASADFGPDLVGDADAGALDGGDGSGDAAPDAPAGPGQLGAPRRVALAYVEVGESVPPADLSLVETTGDAATAGLVITIEGPFAVEGERAALGPGEVRALSVRYTGATMTPTLATGWAAIEAGNDRFVVELAAVVGPATLPSATWTETTFATTTVVDLANAPFPHSSAGYTDRSVLIAIPPGLSEEPALEAVVHYHGFNAVIPATVTGQRLVEQLYYSGRDALLVAPQGPYQAADPNFGKLTEEGGLRRLLEEVLMLLYRDGYTTWPVLDGVVLTSHSGGYAVTATTAKIGGVPILGVQLYDSLYALESTFESVALGGATLRSNHTAGGGTRDNNERLLGLFANDDLSLDVTGSDDSLLAAPVTIVPTDGTHNDCMWHERTAARWLAASGLRRRRDVAPELLLTEAEGEQVRVVWRGDRGAAGVPVAVEGSSDGVAWERLASTTGLEARVALRPWLRVVSVDAAGRASAPSDSYGATGGDWLVVDGFDRVLGGSYAEPTHPFAALIGVALGRRFSTASNEAVAEGLVVLSDYTGVIWLLGDESTHDKTFEAAERAALEDYLDGGGQLIVSGAEVGYATSGVWLSTVLHATYVSDDAGTLDVEGYRFGALYDEDFPDVLDGSEVLWRYATGGGAAVGWDHRIVVVGFGLENLEEDDRAAGVGELVDWLEAE